MKRHSHVKSNERSFVDMVRCFFVLFLLQGVFTHGCIIENAGSSLENLKQFGVEYGSIKDINHNIEGFLDR